MTTATMLNQRADATLNTAIGDECSGSRDASNDPWNFRPERVYLILSKTWHIVRRRQTCSEMKHSRAENF